MLELVTIFLASLLTATTTIWLYRFLAGWEGLKAGVGSRKDMGTGLKLSPQQGFIAPFASSRGVVKTKRLRSPRNSIKAPWGW
jgi:hypothetical protein